MIIRHFFDQDVLKDGICPKTMRECKDKAEGKPCQPLTCSGGPPKLPPALQITIRSPEDTAAATSSSADGPAEWIRPASLEDLKDFISRASGKRIRYIVGNTGHGE